jgi:hypothetical protein
MELYSDPTRRAEEYAARHGLSILESLGSGIQGIVFSTDANTAIKSFIYPEHFERERDVYFRLRDRNIRRVRQFWVPLLRRVADDLRVIEMEIVRPPFVLDFASAYLDERPPYADDRRIMGEWEAQKRELFEDRWPEVRAMLAAFRAHGIYLADVKPGNVAFGDES